MLGAIVRFALELFDSAADEFAELFPADPNLGAINSGNSGAEPAAGGSRPPPTSPGAGVYGKCVCQTTKSAPSTSPSASASPCAKVAPLGFGKFVCQATKSAPSTSPSLSKSPGMALAV